MRPAQAARERRRTPPPRGTRTAPDPPPRGPPVKWEHRGGDCGLGGRSGRGDSRGGARSCTAARYDCPPHRNLVAMRVIFALRLCHNIHHRFSNSVVADLHIRQGTAHERTRRFAPPGICRARIRPLCWRRPRPRGPGEVPTRRRRLGGGAGGAQSLAGCVDCGARGVADNCAVEFPRRRDGSSRRVGAE